MRSILKPITLLLSLRSNDADSAKKPSGVLGFLFGGGADRDEQGEHIPEGEHKKATPLGVFPLWW